MKLISATIRRADGSTHTPSRSISDAESQNERAVQNALAALAGGGQIVRHQIIDTDAPKVMETIGTGEPDAPQNRPEVGIQHDDAVGIVDNEPSGDAPVEDEPHREDMGTLINDPDATVDAALRGEDIDLDSPHMDAVIDAVAGQGEDAFAGIGDAEEVTHGSHSGKSHRTGRTKR